MSVPHQADLHLVAAALRGDDDARQQLDARLAIIGRLVAHRCRRWHGVRSDDVEDLAQSARLVVHARLASFHGLCTLEAWVAKVCQLVVFGESRRRHREAVADLPVELASAEPGPDALTADAEVDHRLWAAVDAIGGIEAEIIRQHHRDEVGFRDIALRTGIPYTTVRTHYYRGLKKVRQRLGSAPSPGGPE